MSAGEKSPQSDGSTDQRIDEALSAAAERISNAPGVKGVVCCGTEGWVYCCKGTLSEESLITITELLNVAGQIEEDDEPPVVQLESEDSSVLMQKSRNGLIVAVHKNNGLSAQNGSRS